MITTLKIKDEPDVLIGSKVVWSEGCKPYRVVLRKLEPGQYVTHKETLGIEGDTFMHDSWFSGNYFSEFPTKDDAKSYEKALDDYRTRVEKL
jgi:hypothetical protein